MPRGRIELSNHVESISVLDADGRVDRALDPKLDIEDMRRLYATMLKARRLDECLVALHRREGPGTYPPCRGQEAASLGPAFVLRRNDWLCPARRELAALLHRGWSMEQIMLCWGGFGYGAVPPAGVNDLPLSGTIAEHCLHAAGVAWGNQLREEGDITLCFIGDGGTSDGDFHEAMNAAGRLQLPLVVVIQNNQWAGHTPRSRQTASATLAQKAVAYGIDGIQADGNDVLAMIVAAGEAVERARKGEGPTLIEAVTYRLSGDTAADHATVEHTPGERADVREAWLTRDPLARFGKYLDERRVFQDGWRERMEEAVEAEVCEAIERYAAFEPDAAEPFRHTFAEMPARLQAQLAEVERPFDACARENPLSGSAGADA